METSCSIFDLYINASKLKKMIWLTMFSNKGSSHSKNSLGVGTPPTIL